MRRHLAWGLFALTLLVAAAHVALLVASRRPMFSTEVVGEGFPLVTIGAIAGAGVGALIITRYPGHPIGWLFLLGQLLSETGVALGIYGHSAVSGQLGEAPGGHLAVWLSIQLGGLFAVALLAVLLLLAPDGRPPSRWSRWALAFPVGGLLAATAAVATVPPRLLDRNGDLVGDPSTALQVALIGAFLAVGVGVLAGTASLWARLRRARGDQRQQLRWVALAAAGLAVGVTLNIGLAVAGAPDWFQPLPLMIAYVCLPVFTGIAILRYRLYEIDIFLIRAIVLTVLTGFVTTTYVCIVVILGRLDSVTHGALWPSLVATALVALAFQPVRQHAGGLANRLVYGARAAPYVQLAEFSKRLQEAPGTLELLHRVSESVAQAVGARATTIRLDVPGRGPLLVTWPDHQAERVAPTATLPVADGTETLGALSVTMPPGTSLRAAEKRLLADFALQLARAFRNVRLQSALVQRVEELRRSTDALEASARRLDLAQDTERQRFEADIARSVLPHLHGVEAALRSLLQQSRGRGRELATAGPVLDECAAQTAASLEALRTLTRGVFPTQLARRGLTVALADHLERTGSGVLRTTIPPDRRFDPRIESAAYFCTVEYLRSLQSPVEVFVTASADRLALDVVTPAPAPEPRALGHLRDRAAALDGRVTVSQEEHAARLALELPLSSPHLLPDLSQAR